MSAPTLTEFLLARIAGDEDEARHARPHSGGSVYANDVHGRLLVQPARVLAECEAKRRIVERAQRPVAHAGQDIERRATLRDLATVYAGHPDYRQEWKP